MASQAPPTNASDPRARGTRGLARRRVLTLWWATLLLLIPFAAGLAPAEAAALRQPEASAPVEASTSRLLLRLSSPPLLAIGRAQVSGDPQLAAALHAEQEAARELVSAALPGATVERSYGLLWNGLAVRVPADDADRAAAMLADLPGITQVSDDLAFHPSTFSSVPYLDLDAVWQAAGGAETAGRGVKIAILDSGIDITHDMFDPTGLAYPTGYPKGEAAYTTAKVIAARAYFRATAPPLAGEGSPVPGPLGSSHGTHLASIAAGRPVTVPYRNQQIDISGVAPGAWLMNYRLFYPSASLSAEVAYSADILQAIEDAVADGADVLLAGWSSAAPRLPFASPVAQALEAAMDAGVVVVAPAGNEGPALGSASRLPGGMARVITVGAIAKPNALAPDVVDVLTAGANMPATLVGAPFARALFGGQIQGIIGPLPYVGVNAVGGNAYACSALPSGSLSGKIALVRRGQCTFADKVYNAQRAGATAVVIYNESPDDAVTEFACAGSHCGSGAITIPSVMVSNEFGLAALSWLTAHPTATLRIDPTGRIIPNDAGELWEGSGRGPAFMRAAKPDVVAPGVSVLAAVHGAEDPQAAYAQLTGTSQAAAHVAGAAALLLQAHPTWTHDQVRAALLASATDEDLSLPPILSPDASKAFSWGAGRVRVDLAAQLQLLASPPSLAFFGMAPGEQRTATITLTDPRTSGRARTYTLSVAPTGAFRVDVRSQITMQPGDQRTVDISVTANSDAALLGTTLRLSSSEHSLRLPLFASSNATLASAQVLLIDNDFSYFGTGSPEATPDYQPAVTAALAAAGLSYVVYEADLYYDNPQTLPNLDVLRRFPVILWLTGDNPHPDGYFVVSTPLTAVDQQLLMDYLDAGGRLIALGPNVAEASDVNPLADAAYGRSALYHGYLGAHWVQGDFLTGSGGGVCGAAGVPGTWLASRAVAFSTAAGPLSVDEIGPGGMPDGSDADLVQGIMAGLGGQAQEQGFVAVSKADEPTLEDDVVGVPYRTITYAFSALLVQATGASTLLPSLLDLSYRWLLDVVATSLPDEIVGAPGALTPISTAATSSYARPIVSYRWSLPGSRQPNPTTADGTISPIYDQPGTYAVAVEATDDLGHKAVARSTVQIVAGGASEFSVAPTQIEPGQELTYHIVVRNPSASPAVMASNVTLPEGLTYVSHLGGEVTDRLWSWSDQLEGDTSFTAELTAQVAPGTAIGTVITAVAEFQAGSASFERTATAQVQGRTLVPLIYR